MATKRKHEKIEAKPEMTLWSVVTVQCDDGSEPRIRDFTSLEKAEKEFSNEFESLNKKIAEEHEEYCGACGYDEDDICDCDSRHCDAIHEDNIGECEGKRQLELEDLEKRAKIIHRDDRNPYGEDSELLKEASDGGYWVIYLIKHSVF